MNRHLPSILLAIALTIIFFTDKPEITNILFIVSIGFIGIDSHLSAIRKRMEDEQA